MIERRDPFSGLTTLVQRKGLASLAIADLGGGSAAWVSQALAQRLQSQGVATLRVGLAEKATSAWSLDDISAHTAISTQQQVASLGAPDHSGPLQLNSLVQALIRWRQEFRTVVVHAGSALDELGGLAISGCEGVLLVVDGGRDDEAKLQRLQVRLNHQGVSLMGVVHNRSGLPRLGRDLAESMARRQPEQWAPAWLERLKSWLSKTPFLNGQWS